MSPVRPTPKLIQRLYELSIEKFTEPLFRSRKKEGFFVANREYESRKYSAPNLIFDPGRKSDLVLKNNSLLNEKPAL
jgi:hypothetical protein